MYTYREKKSQTQTFAQNMSSKTYYDQMSMLKSDFHLNVDSGISNNFKMIDIMIGKISGGVYKFSQMSSSALTYTA